MAGLPDMPNHRCHQLLSGSSSELMSASIKQCQKSVQRYASA